MKSYNSYHSAQSANPNCNIAVSTQKNIDEFNFTGARFIALVKGEFGDESSDGYVYADSHSTSPRIRDGYWEICNADDYSSSDNNQQSNANLTEEK